ncbi:M1 family metallopeptidase [soil metagenome]
MRPLLLFLLASATFLPQMRGENPFDFASTPGKLPKHIVPEEYAIRITPDAKKLTFTGSETIKLDVREPTRTIVLNAAEITITTASLNGKRLPQSAMELDPEDETLIITAPADLPIGKYTLALTFSGKINQQGQGLYYADYAEQGSGAKKRMLGTQFQATDARRMFPCWDEPVFRSRFQLTAIVPENWTAVSNMPVAQETKARGRKELHFAVTPSMPSYLNVLCAGELDFIEKETDGVLHRVFATRGKAEMGRYALASAAQVTRYFHDYFGTPYPLPKLDQIAVPGGFGGAMENWGGITYFESRLLFDPERSSSETKQNIYEVIAHEIAHQWFGNLVTMAWWDNLWLNEGFASWMGSKVTAQFNPEWEVWLRSITPRNPTRRTGIPKETAMAGDARGTTHPIQQPVKTEAEANSAFNPITYQKGQSFIRMLESFLGEEVFRQGIRNYIERHKFSNTTTADLWNALAEASGKPVAEIAAAWTEQPGFPVVMVARAADGKITLTQERFTTNFPDAPPLEWKIPLTYSVAGAGEPVSLLMEEKTAEISDVPTDHAVKFNVAGAGNYRVQYDYGSWKLLLAELPQLSSRDRVNLLSDAWALVQANRAPLLHYLALVEQLPAPTELAEREQIITAFDFISRVIGDHPKRAQFHQYARSVLRPTFDALGWDPKPGESPRHSTLRASLVTALANFGDDDIITGSAERFAIFLKQPQALPPDLRGPVLATVGRYADAAAWTRLHALGRATTSLAEKLEYYDALASSADPQLIARTLKIALTDELPASRAVTLVAKVAKESERPDLTWEFAKANMKQLLAKSDALAATQYAPGLFTFFSEPERITELQEFAKKGLPAGSEKEVEKAVDEISFRAEFKARLLEQMKAWGTGKPPRD